MIQADAYQLILRQGIAYYQKYTIHSVLCMSDVVFFILNTAYSDIWQFTNCFLYNL